MPKARLFEFDVLPDMRSFCSGDANAALRCLLALSLHAVCLHSPGISIHHLMMHSNRCPGVRDVPQRLLSDMPDTGFKAVLQHLDSSQHAMLRQVSHCIRARTTEHVPYINMLLTDASSTSSLQQWCHATRQLEHVTSIRIHMAGPISADVFEAAMQLLAQRSRKVTELRILAAPSDGGSWSGRCWFTGLRSVPYVQSLQPLQHLLADLEELEVQGVHVSNLADDLAQLAAAAATPDGWQLQRLNLLDVCWCLPTERAQGIPSFCAALLHLTDAFPQLKRLGLGLPWKEFKSVSCVNIPSERDDYDDDLEDDYSSESDEEQAPTGSTVESPAAIAFKQQQIAAVTLVAAVANALTKLKQLRVLGLLDIPDIWKPRSVAGPARGAYALQRQRPAVLVAAAEPAATTQMGPVTLDSGPLSSVAAAAAALATLEDWGNWLRQQLPTLKLMYLLLVKDQCYMCWRQDQDQEPLPSVSNTSCQSNSVSTARLHRVSSPWTSARQKPFWAFDDEGSDRGSNVPLNQEFKLQLSRYSPRPFAGLKHLITNCMLSLESEDVISLQTGALLGDMKSLEVLEVHVSCAAGRHDIVHILTATAAPLPSLTSLIIECTGTKQQLQNDLLLPLTAAAGGPGSSLELLELSGSFETDAASSSSTAAASVPEQFKNAVLPPKHDIETHTSGWHEHLLQLTGLHKLVIHQSFDGPPSVLLDLPVECLPVGLQVLDVRRLNIYSCAAVASSKKAKDTAFMAPVAGDHVGRDHSTTRLQLQRLHLADCRLSSPSILASDRLKQLVVVTSCWPGDWATAAAAWPYIKRLAWSEAEAINYRQCKEKYGQLDHFHLREAKLGLSYDDDICHAVQDILVGFRSLTHLNLHAYDLHPWLSVEFLQPLMQHLQRFKQLALHCNYSSVWRVECNAIKQWLHNQLPWASIGIFPWYLRQVLVPQAVE